jgi:hypothetical protein
VMIFSVISLRFMGAPGFEADEACKACASGYHSPDRRTRWARSKLSSPRAGASAEAAGDGALAGTGTEVRISCRCGRPKASQRRISVGAAARIEASWGLVAANMRMAVLLMLPSVGSPV